MVAVLEIKLQIEDIKGGIAIINPFGGVIITPNKSFWTKIFQIPKEMLITGNFEQDKQELLSEIEVGI